MAAWVYFRHHILLIPGMKEPKNRGRTENSNYSQQQRAVTTLHIEGCVCTWFSSLWAGVRGSGQRWGWGWGWGGMLRTQRAESSVIHFLDCTPKSPATYVKASPWNSWQLLQAIFITAPPGKASTRKMRAEGRLSRQPYNFQDRMLTYPSCEQRFRKSEVSCDNLSCCGTACAWFAVPVAFERENQPQDDSAAVVREERRPVNTDSILRVWWRTLPLDTEERIIVHSWCYNSSETFSYLSGWRLCMCARGFPKTEPAKTITTW